MGVFFMWILAITSLVIFMRYLVKRKKVITAVRLTVEKIVLSAIFLIIVNIVSNYFGLQVGINEYTVSVVCVLGVPGLIVVLIIQNVIFV